MEHSINNLLKRIGKEIQLPPATTIFRHGDPCNSYIIVKSGKVKVFTRNDAGREILLYKVSNGESCTLTTSCLLADNTYPADGVTESDVTAYVLTAKSFNNQLNQSDQFRRFVFDSYGQRIRDVISLVTSVSFGRLEQRLANWLLINSTDCSIIKTTHQLIATELGTAREVISRHLNEYQQNGWLILSRGQIKITNAQNLKNLTVM